MSQAAGIRSADTTTPIAAGGRRAMTRVLSRHRHGAAPLTRQPRFDRPTGNVAHASTLGMGNSCPREQAQEGHATDQRRHLAEGDIHWIAAGAELSIAS